MIDLSKIDLNAISDEELLEIVGYDNAVEIARKFTVDKAAKEAGQTLLKFTQYTMPDPNADERDFLKSRYKIAPIHRLLAEAMTSVMEGKTLKLAISVPPQHGKSEIASRRFMAYHIGKLPWKNVLFGTYNQPFAEEFGDDVRSIVEHERFKKVFPTARFKAGSRARDHMVTEDGGKISFLGRGGSGSGRPADGFLIDDPMKDAKEAESMTTRNDVWNWFTRVVNARCHRLAWQIIIATRWHEDDLIGRLINPKNPYYKKDVAKNWTYINIPAIVDDPKIAEALGQEVGSALWAERFPLETLEIARSMDPYGFSALYMGRPTPPEGAFYKIGHLKEYDSPKQLPKNFRSYMTGDLAVSPDRTADRTCVGIWLLDENDELWLHPDLYWERKASDESVEEIVDRGKRFQVFEAWFEKGQLDKAVGPFLEKRMEERKVYFNISKLPTVGVGSKGLRSTSFRGRCAQGKVHFPGFAWWWASAKESMLKFTGSGNDMDDDFPDMCALIGQALDDQIKASAPADATVYPKFGTFGHLKWVATQAARRRKHLRLVRSL